MSKIFWPDSYQAMSGNITIQPTTISNSFSGSFSSMDWGTIMQDSSVQSISIDHYTGGYPIITITKTEGNSWVQYYPNMNKFKKLNYETNGVKHHHPLTNLFI